MELKLEVGAEWEPVGAGYRHAHLPLRIDVVEGEPTGSGNERQLRSAAGWHVTLDERQTDDGQQLRARYSVYEWTVDVIVTGPQAEIAARRRELEAIVLSGRPDWSREIACLAQLFVDVEE